MAVAVYLRLTVYQEAISEYPQAPIEYLEPLSGYSKALSGYPEAPNEYPEASLIQRPRLSLVLGGLCLVSSPEL